MTTFSTKQVIVVRSDLKMKPGKLASQVAHASMGALLINREINHFSDGVKTCGVVIPYDEYVINWLSSAFTKIVLKCGSEEDLFIIQKKCLEIDMRHSLITDNGTTVFGGIPTNTCIAVGPGEICKIDEITSSYKLYN